MRVIGIDFTSAPSRSKHITQLICDFNDGLLSPIHYARWQDFEHFEEFLREPGPWIAGIDFPFGQSRRFIENSNWPMDWTAYTARLAEMTDKEFQEELELYKIGRAQGDKEHRRKIDILASSISPQKLYGVPVAKMFFQGVRRISRANVTIPHLKRGDLERIVVEAYPGVLARQLIGRQPYKNDTKSKQTPALEAARSEIITLLKNDAVVESHGVELQISKDLTDEMILDASGDLLDALLCAIQAAWSWTKRDEGFGAPPDVDTLEGWIADPMPRPN